MVRYLLRRAGNALVLIFITLTATFFIVRLAPGDPVDRYYSPDIDPSVMETMRHRLGLDDPLPVQYVKTMWSFVHGDFGVSMTQHRPVSELLAEAIPRTLQLTAAALLLQIVLGLGLGTISAARRYTTLDKSFSTAFLLLYSIPSFYIAYLLIAVFSLGLHWLPSAGMLSIPAGGGGTGGLVADRLLHMVLPVLVLGLGSAAALGRYTRGSLLDVINQEFIRTARAKGVSERDVVLKHALRNALPQILTVIGLSVPFLLGGAVVIEKVFAWPGMGALAVDSIFARDYPVVLATNLVAACMVILGNLLADLSYLWADPRIKAAPE